jgi:hypothetical protein
MFRSKLIVPALVVACLLGSQAVVPSVASASVLRAADHSVLPMFGNKVVKLSLANNTSNALDVKVGETPMTIAPGATVQVSAPAGTKIVVATATSSHAAGDVLAEVSSELSGATIRINN